MLVLWLVLILSLIMLSYSTSVRTGVSITGNRASKVRARYFAKAGIERTICELTQVQDFYYSESSGFYNDPARFANQVLGDGTFSLLTKKRDDLGNVIYGITDEAGRLNVNTATEDQLLSFPEMTTEMAESLLDWVDTDSDTRADGAEDDYYQMLDDPYYCKNGPVQDPSELSMVKGWTPVEVFGEDANENGRLDPNEDDGDVSPPLDDGDGELDEGLAKFFTIYSHDKEINPNGEARLDLNAATAEELQQIEGMTQSQAQSIVAWRNQKRFSSLADLLDVTVAQQDTSSGKGGPSGLRKSSQKTSSLRTSKASSSGGRDSSMKTSSGGSGSSSGSGGQSGQTQNAFTYDQVVPLVDWVCVGTPDKRNRININVAPLEVLLTLPGMTESLADEILTRRESSQGAFTQRSELRDVNGMTQETFRGMIDDVTVQSYQFRIVSEGRDGETKTTIEAVVDLASDPPKILYWHES